MTRKVERGAIVAIKGQVFTVTDVRPAPASATPHSWPDHWRTAAVHAVLTDDDGATYDATLPARPHHHPAVQVLAGPDDEGHWPACSKCGEPWPCREVETIRLAGRRADALLSRIEYEADHPWPCTWCGTFTGRRPRRFATERGMKQHLRACPMNPATWDVSRWLHVFNDDLHIVGGTDPICLTGPADAVPAAARQASARFGDLDRLVAINRAVRQAALNGTLPDRLDQLDLDGPP